MDQLLKGTVFHFAVIMPGNTAHIPSKLNSPKKKKKSLGACQPVAAVALHIFPVAILPTIHQSRP